MRERFSAKNINVHRRTGLLVETTPTDAPFGQAMVKEVGSDQLRPSQKLPDVCCTKNASFSILSFSLGGRKSNPHHPSEIPANTGTPGTEKEVDLQNWGLHLITILIDPTQLRASTHRSQTHRAAIDPGRADAAPELPSP